MKEWDDFGKDIKFTITINEFMQILKVYDEIKAKRHKEIPCQMDDELYYPSLILTCISLIMTERKTQQDKRLKEMR